MNYTTEQLEKAFELACDYLVDSYNFPDADTDVKIFFDDGRGKYAYDLTIQEWKEYFLSEVSK